MPTRKFEIMMIAAKVMRRAVVLSGLPADRALHSLGEDQQPNMRKSAGAPTMLGKWLQVQKVREMIGVVLPIGLG